MRPATHRTIAVACVAFAFTAAAALAQPGGPVGVIIAPVGQELSEAEAQFADALIDELTRGGATAMLLHGQSPCLLAAGARLPSVHAGDDWTPLGNVLSRLTTHLRLDYVLLASVSAGEEAHAASGMVVVRGGESRVVQAEAGAPAAVAADLAARFVASAAEMPAPQDPVDEPVAAPVQIESPERPDQAAPPDAGDELDEAEHPGPAPEEDHPRPSADEPQAAPGTDETTADREPGDETGAEDPLAAARAAYEEGDLARAAELLGQSREQHGVSGRYYLLRARLHIASRRHEDAFSDLQQAVAVEPGLVEARVRLARLLAERGQWQAARDHYEQALQIEPLNIDALLGLSRVYRDHGHRRKAIALLTDAFDAGTREPELLTLLGDLHALEDNFEQAVGFYSQAVAATDGERAAQILERLGDLYASRREHRDALACYSRAAELSPSRSSMMARRYVEVMSAADGSVHDALTAGWSAFEEHIVDGVGEREIVFRRLSEIRRQLSEAMGFAEAVRPPAELRAKHVRRQFAYSLAVEATVSALSYLDLGGEQMRERALQRHAEALAELQKLRSGGED